MLYPIPESVKNIGWNGTNLFYVGLDNQTLTKCAGDVNRADFGKEISSVKQDFIRREDPDR